VCRFHINKSPRQRSHAHSWVHHHTGSPSHQFTRQHAHSHTGTKLVFNPHNSTRLPRQRLPSSLLIENASARCPRSTEPFCPRHFRSSLATTQASLTMPARVKNFFCIFCSLFSFFGHTTPFTLKSGLICSVKSCFDDHGSFVIFRSVSVRPKHLFDPYFDHDY